MQRPPRSAGSDDQLAQRSPARTLAVLNAAARPTSFVQWRASIFQKMKLSLRLLCNNVAPDLGEGTQF